MNLKNKKLWLFDMDGTIYKDSTLFDGTLPLLSKIKSIGGQAVFVTNNSSLSAKDYVEKLIRLGIDCTENDIFSSTHATALYINENFPKKRVFCVGTASMVQELKKFGVNAVTDTDGAEIVLLGFDTELTHKKLRDACVLLTGDIPYIATNPDYVCPTSFGSVPDCGSIAVMLEYAVKKKPLFIGKPSPVLIELAMKKLSFTKEETVMVGDRIYTDILAGIAAGVTTVCVLSGEATETDIQKSEKKPDFVFCDVGEINLFLG